MEIKELNLLIQDRKSLERRITFYEKRKIILKQKPDVLEIKGHLEKADHNLEFINDNLKLGYHDWCITGCYYAVYHASLGLILLKGYFSKNHDATLCILIKEYYKNGVSEEDLTLINQLFLNYLDLIIYVQTKKKREEASYSTRYEFNKETVEELRSKAIHFINKAREILKELH